VFAKFLKFLIALALLPLLAGEIWALIELARLAASQGKWSDTWVFALVAGSAIWLAVFLLLPRPMWLYVLGHEFTHALAAMLAGGKVTAFKVTSKGGHIMTDRVNWWIALSPYFVPIYAFIWIALWLTINFYYPLNKWQPLLFFGIGLFWCFHLTFTVSMFHLRQTDLTSQGVIFSAVIILVFNLAVFLAPASLLSHDLKKAGQTMLHCTAQSYVITGQGMKSAADWALKTWHDQHQNP